MITQVFNRELPVLFNRQKRRMFEEVTMKGSGTLIVSVLITFMLLPSCTDTAKAATFELKDRGRQISLPHAGNSATLKATLRPNSKHLYWFRGRGGQDMNIKLQIQKDGLGRDGDVVFWVQGRNWYPRDRFNAILEGIDKGGVTNWSGILPGTGEYEIYVSNPPISDHPIRRSLQYELRIAINSQQS
jgi:hypothetical protein